MRSDRISVARIDIEEDAPARVESTLKARWQSRTNTCLTAYLCNIELTVELQKQRHWSIEVDAVASW